MNLSKKSVKPRKKIYICHQAYEKSHFKALYDCAEAYGYEIVDFIVLNQRNIKSEFVKSWHTGKYLSSILEYVKAQYKLIKIRTLRGELLVVGIAPYDYLMNQYEKMFAKNKSIYFTSWQHWDSSLCARGDIGNKARFEEIIKKNFTGITCVSDITAEGITRFNLPYGVVKHAVDGKNYVTKQDYARTYKYIFLGRLEKIKNIKVILKYLENHPELEMSFDFAGEGALEADIKRAARKDRRIRYLGKWSKEEIKTKLHEYDFLVLPSWREPYGIVLLEALSSGVPCIVSDALGPSEIIQNRHDGLVFGLKDEDGFAKVMDKSYAIPPKEYKELCINAIREGYKYSSDEVIKIWISLFQQIGL